MLIPTLRTAGLKLTLHRIAEFGSSTKRSHKFFITPVLSIFKSMILFIHCYYFFHINVIYNLTGQNFLLPDIMKMHRVPCFMLLRHGQADPNKWQAQT